MLVDSHCHLNYPDFQDDLPEVMKRAEQNGITTFLTINTRLSETVAIQEIAAQYPTVYCTVGVHPHDAEAYVYEGVKEEIRAFAKHPKVVGLGETGLDYYYNNSPKKQQIQSFRTHSELAIELGLPLIIHTRDADEDTIAVLDDYKAATGVFHCFSGTNALARQALDRGFYLSLSGILTFKKATHLQEIAKWAPLDRLLVETDAPFLAPIPHRGKRNEPAFTKYTAEFLADLRGISFEEIAKVTTDNFFNLFQKAVKLECK